MSQSVADQAPPSTVELPDGRLLAYDDLGSPDWWPIVYCHGTPDSRRARHPDDDWARAEGVRLLAVDRPGIGASTHDPDRTLGSFADDIADLLDRLGIDRCSVLGWSAGAMPALALAARHPGRVVRAAVVAGLVPFTAYEDPEVLEAAGEGRRAFVATARGLAPEVVGRDLAPMFVPHPLDLGGARAHIRAGWDAVEEAEAHSVPGALDAMAAGLLDATAGPSCTLGLERDLALQVADPDVELSDVAAPVELIYGTGDPVCPPAMGRWFAAQLTTANLDVVDGAGHLLALTRWPELLRHLS